MGQWIVIMKCALASWYLFMILPLLLVVDNKWLQQQIPACRPVYTAISASIGFIIIGIAFLIIGAIFTAFSSNVSLSSTHMISWCLCRFLKSVGQRRKDFLTLQEICNTCLWVCTDDCYSLNYRKMCTYFRFLHSCFCVKLNSYLFSLIPGNVCVLIHSLTNNGSYFEEISINFSYLVVSHIYLDSIEHGLPFMVSLKP